MLNKAAYLFGFLEKQSSVHEEMVSSEQTCTPHHPSLTLDTPYKIRTQTN